MLFVPYTPPAYATSSAVINPIGYVNALFPSLLPFVVYKSPLGQSNVGCLFLINLIYPP